MTATSMRPRRQDFWPWRLCATALAFVGFGVGAVLLRVLVFPAQRLLGGSAQTRQRRARRVVRHAFGLLARTMQFTGLIRLDCQGIEQLGRPGQMIIANHPSLIDVVFLIWLVPNANCIVRHGLARNLFTGGPIAACGYITNDESLEMFERAVAALQAGETLIVFPEGTRTPPGEHPRFHRGACAIALRGAREIAPVVITMSPPCLTKGEPWYRIPARRAHCRIAVGAPLAPAHWRAAHALPQAGRRLLAYLHAWYGERLSSSAP